MNRDDVLCKKAIQDFWNNERELIKQGKGTRDWTPEQQLDIMAYKQNGTERKNAGVPKDETGKAYEGQHMKSAEEYPEYQGQASNIQALTRNEHLTAHNGNWTNATNWFYDPATGEKTMFGDSEPTKPEPIDLSDPYIADSNKMIAEPYEEFSTIIGNAGASSNREYPPPNTVPMRDRELDQGGEPRMKTIDVGKIKISPFEFESLIEVRIEKKLSEHSTLYVCGIIKDEHQFVPVMDKTEGVKVKCENDGVVYFIGVLQNVKITCVDAVYRMEVYAISNTILLDTVKHKRSFQDNAQNYQSIVETIIADNGGAVKYNSSAMSVENIILQYNETDWEFAKRLASHTNDVLIPIIDDSPTFHFGVPGTGGAQILSKDYSISKDFDAIRRFDATNDLEKEKKARPISLTADDVSIYCVETDSYTCDIGEKLKLNGVDLHVCHMLLSFVNSALTVVYTLCAKKAISTPKFYNPATTGLVLDGKVLEVENDKVKLKLDNNKIRGVEKDTDKAHFFKYATGYSMENHTGWYVMPEEGDIVQLLFPLEDEKFAYAASSLRQEDTEKTTDPLVKYWRTSFGREIKMDKDEILISTVDDETFIRIHKDDGGDGDSLGLEIITPNRVLVKSGSKLTIQSDDNMTISTPKEMFIDAGKSMKIAGGGSSIIMDKSGIDLHGKEVRQN
jgi:hypothetical protein